MGYIYCITNTINNKKYVGKTLLSVEKRFSEHISDRSRRKVEKRPLYAAMNKYGPDKFTVEVLEEVIDDTLLNERETYWIEKLNTYGSSGYNATRGGDGKQLYDRQLIVNLIKQGYTIPDIVSKIGCCPETVIAVERQYSIYVRKSFAKLIGRFELTTGNLLDIHFGSLNAAQFLRSILIDNEKIQKQPLKTLGTTILRNCRGEKESAYGFIWKYLPDPE